MIKYRGMVISHHITLLAAYILYWMWLQFSSQSNAADRIPGMRKATYARMKTSQAPMRMGLLYINHSMPLVQFAINIKLIVIP